MNETPTILDSSHKHTIYGLGNLGAPTNVAGTMTLGGNQFIGAAGQGGQGGQGGWLGDLQQQAQAFANYPALQLKNRRMKVHEEEEAMADKPTRRFVQVFIADTDDNIPLDKSLLYEGTPKLTDATDQELFFEIDIKDMLARHNAERVKLIDKKVKDRTEHLEPARIRDLKMVVVNIASFG